jgi:hypothetical protein
MEKPKIINVVECPSCSIPKGWVHSIFYVELFKNKKR